MTNLSAQQVNTQGQSDSTTQKKQIELLQKQVEVLEKMVRLLADQLKKQPGGPAMEQLQIQTATLEGRSVQAARERT